VIKDATWFRGLVACAAVMVASCGLPLDTSGTLDRATGGTLRVGMSADEPWTAVTQSGRDGIEVRLLQEFAAGIAAQIEWQDGGEESLMQLLDSGELDVVIGGFTANSPWSDKAALTLPYVVSPSEDGSEEQHVMAVALGENALLVAIEQFLLTRSNEVAAQVGGTPP
jgi:polar amino acid transport system substrate-binding protein